MGNMNYVVNPYDLLKEKPPKVELAISLNVAYINFIFPTGGDSSEIIHKVVIDILEYGSLPNGDIDLDNIIDSKLVSLYPGQTSYAEQSPDKPFHMVTKSINNSWYLFNFVYTYRPAPSNEGNNLFYSNQTTISVNNTNPIIHKKTISKYMIGLFREKLEEISKINIWYNTDINNPNIGDIVYTDLYQAQMVSRLSIDAGDPNPFTLSPMDFSYQKATIFFRKNPEIKQTILTFFKNQLPQNGEISFTFDFDFKRYTITIRGNIEEYLNDTQFIIEET